MTDTNQQTPEQVAREREVYRSLEVVIDLLLTEANDAHHKGDVREEMIANTALNALSAKWPQVAHYVNSLHQQPKAAS